MFREILAFTNVCQAFPKIIRFDEQADNPESPAEGSKYTNGNAVNSGMVSSRL